MILESHLQFHVDDNLRSGMSLEEARRQAFIALGGVEQTKEIYRERRSLPMIETLLQDLRYSMRRLRKSPGFASLVILILALGIGANTAIFTVVDAVLLKPLSYPQPDRIVAASLSVKENPALRSSYGTADFLAAQARQTSFAAFAAFSQPGDSITYTGGSEPLQIHGTMATADFFSVLGINPMLGRTFAPGEDRPGRDRVVVLSHSFWQQHFGADPRAIGRAITLNGASDTIIGVMPANFHFGPRDNDDLWPVLQLAPREVRYPYWLSPIGRLEPGISEAQAAADLTMIAGDLQRQIPNSDYSAAYLQPLKSQLVGDVRTALLFLLGAVTLVLLIATVNVASLEIVQATSREREMAIRSALGASRRRIARQVLAESVMLAVLGGVLGLLLAYKGVDLLLAMIPTGIPRLKEVTVNGSVLAFTATVSLFSGLLFGIAPLLHGYGERLYETLRAGTHNLTDHRGRHGLRNGLVVIEVSLSIVLLVGAVLMLRSFERLSSTSPGFDPQSLVTATVSLPEAAYVKETQINSFYDQLLDRLQNSAGLDSAAVSMSLPPNLLAITNPFHVPGEPLVPGQSLPLAVETTVSSGYFRTLGIPLLRGRVFSDSDRNRTDEILIVNDALARRYFPGKDPVGQRIQTGDPDPKAPWETIVGVVGDVKYSGLDATLQPTLYKPYFEAGWTSWSREMFIVIRTNADPKAVASTLRSAVQSLDGNLPVSDVHTMNDLLSKSVAQPRFRTLLLGIFAAVALLLAVVGIFGVMSYLVGRRTQEIGVRMALGATRGKVLRMILGEGLRVVLVGVALGLIEALLLGRLVKSLLFGIQPADPLTFLGSAILLTIVALAACYLPARRAMSVDPMVALRHE
ncbi:MAG TPA: ABC transporter permease [Candidatus Acidoferrales bacterium]|nr:ABC transporter permease [Candidatus Acidoferrales bacterium]